MSGIPKRNTLESSVKSNVLTALNYIENAYTALCVAIKDENQLGSIDRNQLYQYGMSDAQIHKVKLANIKKAILSITGNQRYKPVKEDDHEES